MAAFQSPNSTFRAGGTIAPFRFVKQSGNYGAVQAGAGEAPIGVSQQATNAFNVTDVAASSGQPIGVYGNSQECWLEFGGSVTAGDRLKSDSAGKGVTASGSDGSGAVALEGGSSGNLYRVRVQIANPGTGATGATGPAGATGATGPGA